MWVPGVNLPVLVRVAVDRVVEEVRADAAVVQQRVALPGRAVAGDRLAGALGVDQELEQLRIWSLSPARANRPYVSMRR